MGASLPRSMGWAEYCGDVASEALLPAARMRPRSASARPIWKRAFRPRI